MEVELEHALGFSGSVPCALHALPGDRFVSCVGSTAVLNSTVDPHEQLFLRGHTDNISATGLSESRALLATGQRTEADVVVWDLASGTGKYKLQEHDGTVSAVGFTHDERVLVTAATDGLLFAWDMATGAIIAKAKQREVPTLAIACGGFIKDAKGRDTSLYQFATAGCGGLSLWALDPVRGRLESDRIASPGISRDYLTAAFAAVPERPWLYAGTTSGDLAIVHVRSRVVHEVVPVCGGGVCSLAALPNRHIMGGTGTLLLVGSGDGALVVSVHLAASLEHGAVLAAAGVGAQPPGVMGRGGAGVGGVAGMASAVGVQRGGGSRGGGGAGSGLLVKLQTVSIGGSGAAVWSIAPVPEDAAMRGASSAGELMCLVGSSAGVIYRCLLSLAGSGGAVLTALRQSHAAAATSLAGAAVALAALFPPPVVSASPVAPGAAGSSGGGGAPSGGGAAALLAGLPQPLQASGMCPDVLAVAFPPRASGLFVTAASDGCVRVWDNTDHRALAAYAAAGGAGAGFPVCVAAGEDFLVSGWQDGCVRAWMLLPPPAGSAGAGAGAGGAMPPPAAAAASGRRAGASAASAAAVSSSAAAVPPLWFIADAHPAREGGVTALALARSERLLVTGGASGSVRCWDVRTRALLCQFKEHSGAVTQLLVLPGDAVAVSVSRDKSLCTWDLVAGRRRTVHLTRAGALNAVAVLPATPAAVVAAAARSGGGGGSEPAAAAAAAAAAADAPVFVTAGQDHSLALWDVRQAAPLRVVPYPAAPRSADTALAVRGSSGGGARGIGGAECDPEATCIAVPHVRRDIFATGGTDGLLRFWSIPALRLLSEHPGASGAVRDAAFSPDDKQCVCTGSDGTVLVWNVF